MKIILFLISLWLISISAFTQDVNLEINLGLGLGFSKDSKGRGVEDNSSLSFGTKVSLDYLEENKLSSGIDFTFTGWNRKDSGLNQKSFITLLFTDYNYPINNNFKLFGGGGIGYSYVLESSDGGRDRGINNIAFVPRAGIAYKKLSLTTQYNYQGNKNSFLNIKIGYKIL